METAIQQLVWAHAHAPEGARAVAKVRGGELPCDPGRLRAGGAWGAGCGLLLAR